MNNQEEIKNKIIDLIWEHDKNPNRGLTADKIMALLNPVEKSAFIYPTKKEVKGLVKFANDLHTAPSPNEAPKGEHATLKNPCYCECHTEGDEDECPKCKYAQPPAPDKELEKELTGEEALFIGWILSEFYTKGNKTSIKTVAFDALRHAYKHHKAILKAKDQEAYNKGRSEALDEEFDKAEKTSKVAEENYKRGYNDAKKGRKPAPHDTRDGYCCACDYDLACMEDKIKKQDQEADRRVEEVIRKTRENIIGRLRTKTIEYYRRGRLDKDAHTVFRGFLSAEAQALKKKLSQDKGKLSSK